MKRKLPDSTGEKVEARGVLTYFPESIVRIIDHAVSIEDTDRSKFIRAACREKLQRLGVHTEVVQ